MFVNEWKNEMILECLSEQAEKEKLIFYSKIKKNSKWKEQKVFFSSNKKINSSYWKQLQLQLH